MQNLLLPGRPESWYVSPDDNGQLGPGYTVEDLFCDTRGRFWRLKQLVSNLAGDTTAAGQVLVIDSGGGHLVTNDVSAGVDATNPIAAGIVAGAFAESTSETTTSTGAKFILVLVNGMYEEVVTNADDDIAIGDFLIPDPNTDGAVDSFAPASTVDANEAIKIMKSVFAWALAADTDADDVVKAFIHVKS